MDIRNNLALLRTKRGLGASQLAAEIGISRQTVYAIEAGTYVPNTAVSLKLARVLDATVEEIFQIDPELPASAETAEAIVLGGMEPALPGQLLRLCRVNGHLVAIPPEPGGWGLQAMDAVLLTPIRNGKQNSRAKVKILGNSWDHAARILIAGCDPSTSILANALQRQGCELVIDYENSTRSLELLQEGLVHIAGTHLVDKVTGKTDLLPVTKIFPRSSIAIISYAMWQEGLVVVRGNPKKIVNIADLARKGVHIVNREPGAGCRRLLDDMLREHDIPSSQVKGYEQVIAGHFPAARMVQSGAADCCISTEAVARSLGLDFIPLAEKPYHLVIRRAQLDLPPIQTLCETLGHSSFRNEVEICTGYNMHTAGDRLV
jgi:molybdate-binding protein/DNA-binding XRE family transcriptional regulator